MSPLGKPVWDGNRHVLAWSATKGDGNAEIHAQRYDKNGAPMDVPAVKIASFPRGRRGRAARPTLATNGADTSHRVRPADHAPDPRRSPPPPASP